jgi:hypothetical protein
VDLPPQREAEGRRSSPRAYPGGIRIEIVSASLFFCSDFSGDELKGDENQAARSSGRANRHGSRARSSLSLSYPLP